MVSISEKGPLEDNLDEYLDDNVLISLLLLTDRNVKDSREEIRISFVSAVLANFSKGDTFHVRTIVERIKTLTKCDIDSETVVAILDDFVNSGIISHRNNMQYVLNEQLSPPDFCRITDIIWNDFQNYFREKKEPIDVEFDSNARKIFDKTIFDILMGIAKTLYELDIQIESIQEISLPDTISNNVSELFLTKETKDKFPSLLKEYFLSESPQIQSFIFSAYSKLLSLSILHHEQYLPQVKNIDNLSFIVLDTSFLVNLLCETAPAHPLAEAVISRCNKINIPIYFLSATRDELSRLIDASNREMGTFSPTGKHAVTQNQFVDDFRHQYAGTKGISWGEYLEIIKGKYRKIDKIFNILDLPNEEQISIDQDVVGYVETTLKILERGQKKDEDRNSHDAYCLGIISSLRRNRETYEGEDIFGPWFITYDNTVAKVDGLYQAFHHKEKMVIQPRSLLNYFMLYSKLGFNDKDKKEVYEAIIRYTLTKQNKIITLDEYATLVTYKIGLLKEDIDTIKKIIFNHPLREEIRRALEADRGDLAENATLTILGDETYIENIIDLRKTRERVNKIAQEKQELEEENRNLKIRNETLMEVNSFMNKDERDQFIDIIHKLEKAGAFKNKSIPQLKGSKKQQILDWLRDFERQITTVKNIAQSIKELAPIAASLYTALNK